MKRIVVPIGIDSSVAQVLDQLKLRDKSYPFDWNVTYNGVSDVIKNNFSDFIPCGRYGKTTFMNNCTVFNKYGTLFIHDDWIGNYEKEKNKYDKRIQRFQKLLTDTPTEQTIYFIRKGHVYVHHNEYYFKDDIQSVEEFSQYLKQTYPKLKYKIFIIICCTICYKYDIEYASSDKHIIIINNSENMFVNSINGNLYDCIKNHIVPILQ